MRRQGIPGLIAALMLWTVQPAQARLIPVTPASLDQSLREAKSGDTLVLSPGRYTGPIRLAPGVSLDGNGSILEFGGDTSPAVVLEGTNRVHHLIVHGLDRSEIGIRVLRGPVTFFRVEVRGFRRYGIRAGRGEGNFLEGTIERCGEDGLSAAGGRWTVQSSRFMNNGDDGIDLFRSNSSIIASSIFDANADAAVELAISQDVRMIGNISRGNRVTCAARLGNLPARFSNNRLADRVYLEKRGESPISTWEELQRRADATNVKLESDTFDPPPAVPIEIQIVQAAAGSAPAAKASASVALEVASRARSRAAEHLPYAGLQLSDVAMKGQLGSDTNISPLLRRVLEDPFSLGTWLAERTLDGDSPTTARYRQYASDLGMSLSLPDDTEPLSSGNPKEFSESLIRQWSRIDEFYRSAFAAFDSESMGALLGDLQAQYAEEPELGLPLVEDFEFDVEMDKQLNELMKRAAKVDTSALFGSGAHWIGLLLKIPAALKNLQPRLTAKQVSQPMIYRRQTPWGPLVIAGTGNDRHDSVTGFVFDLGGDDRYAALDGGDRPVVIVDLSGDDVYSGAIASGIGRFSAVWDGEGNDKYESGSRTQGSGLLGIGILIDESGNDQYLASRYSQGFGFFGAGWLRDGGGDDVYRMPGYGQGFGGVRGLGVLDDAAGNDRYEILPVNNDPIRDPSRTTSMGQGIGEGLRPQGAGGIGILWDGGGRDEYQADLFAQGIGYWFGFGALIDVGEANDQYTGYHYVQGAGVHLSVGAVYDGGGADRYQAWYVSQGCGHDVSLGALYDIGGNDIYSAYGLSQGAGSTNGVGLLCDGSGRDAYMGVARPSGQGDAWYQARLREYGSVGILLDLGGDDYYASGSLNNSVWIKGDHGLGVDE